MTEEPEVGDLSPADGDWVRLPLSRLPTPNIPVDVFDRVTHAIVESAKDRADADGSPTPTTPTFPPVKATDSPNTNRRWWVVAGGVAAAGVAAAFAVSALPLMGGSPGTVNAGASRATGSAAVETAQIVPVSSGVQYTVDNVGLAVPHVMAAPAIEAPEDSIAATFAATPEGITSCLEGVGYPPQDLALLDIARFQERPVAVLAYLSEAADPTADVVVVGIRCDRSDPQVRHRDVANMGR